MALPSTLKRHDPSSNHNDSLNDDDDDVTWGGKRRRYIYNFVLDDTPLTPLYDTDETESVHSGQSKSTIQLVSDLDDSSNSSCSGGCECHSSASNLTEFDVRSTSSCHYIDSNISDSSSTMDFKAEENNTMRDEAVLNSDVGYLRSYDTTDVPEERTERGKWPPPACFQFCLQCGKNNPNPFFQFCHSCFRYRMEYFEDKPDPTLKRNKRLKSSGPKKEEKDFEEHDSIPNSQESGYSSLLSQEENKNLKDIETNMAEKDKNPNLCNICQHRPKNGIYNHNKIGHVHSCFHCARKVWKKKGKCPVCNLKIKFVTKIIIV